MEANIVDDEFLEIGDLFYASRYAQSGKLMVAGNRMKEDLVAAVVDVELEPVLRKTLKNIGDTK